MIIGRVPQAAFDNPIHFGSGLPAQARECAGLTATAERWVLMRFIFVLLITWHCSQETVPSVIV